LFARVLSLPNLPTPRRYLNLHRVDAACRSCDHITTLDLAALVASGHGDTALIHLPLRCSQCGAMGHGIIITGKSFRLRQKLQV
jgi:hypothetical protein